MTPAEYSKRYGQKVRTVLKWLENEDIYGARRNANNTWFIPENARPRYRIRKKNNRTAADNLWDVLQALNKLQYVDARVLCCHETDFKDAIQILLDEGLICESDTSCDGQWNTGFALTAKGSEYIAKNKGHFLDLYRETIAGVTRGAVEGMVP